MAEMMESLFVLRPAREDDMPYVHSYAYAEGMDNPESPEGITVAVNDEDIPVGFCRVELAEGVAYIHPVVVTKTWRRYGVGRALMENAAVQHGELRLVARGVNAPFYEALGFSNCAWECIAPAIAGDCEGCELRDECQPQPMLRV